MEHLATCVYLCMCIVHVYVYVYVHIYMYVYVIDTRLSQCQRYDPHTKNSSLMSALIAKANAKQRSGRAGRCQPGILQNS